MNHPLDKALHKLDTTSRILKWPIELSEFDIEYQPRTTIKAQALADLIFKTRYEDTFEPTVTWQIVVDGSGAQTGAGAGVVTTSLDEETFEYAVRFGFTTYNIAALAGIYLSIAAEAKRIVMITDSQWVFSQTKGTYEARESGMQEL